MIPQTVTVNTPTGASKVIVLDGARTPFNVSVFCLGSGTVNYTVRYTADNVWASSYNPTTGNWFTGNSTGIANMAALANASGSALGSFVGPVTAAQLVMNSGSGSVTATFVQAGLYGGG